MMRYSGKPLGIVATLLIILLALVKWQRTPHPDLASPEKNFDALVKALLDNNSERVARLCTAQGSKFILGETNTAYHSRSLVEFGHVLSHAKPLTRYVKSHKEVLLTGKIPTNVSDISKKHVDSRYGVTWHFYFVAVEDSWKERGWKFDGLSYPVE
jgi:hypothetical protein